MVFALLFTNFQSLSYVFAHDNISSGYSFEQSYDEKTNTVVIKGNGNNVPNNVQITSIKADDGTEINLENPEYTAKENKDYSFSISYLVFTQDGENISSDAREETKKVSVTDIKNQNMTSIEGETIAEEKPNTTNEEIKDSTISKAGNGFVVTADNPKEAEVYNISLSIDLKTGYSNYIAKLKLPKEVKISSDFNHEDIDSIKGYI